MPSKLPPGWIQRPMGFGSVVVTNRFGQRVYVHSARLRLEASITPGGGILAVRQAGDHLVVSLPSGSGYVERPFGYGNVAFQHRRFYRGSVHNSDIYLMPVAFGGMQMDSYVPSYYYGDPAYQWVEQTQMDGMVQNLTAQVYDYQALTQQQQAELQDLFRSQAQTQLELEQTWARQPQSAPPVLIPDPSAGTVTPGPLGQPAQGHRAVALLVHERYSATAVDSRNAPLGECILSKGDVLKVDRKPEGDLSSFTATVFSAGSELNECGRDSLVALDAKKYQEMVIDLDYDNDLMMATLARLNHPGDPSFQPTSSPFKQAATPENDQSAPIEIQTLNNDKQKTTTEGNF
jgi:hypothetical protein